MYSRAWAPAYPGEKAPADVRHDVWGKRGLFHVAALAGLRRQELLGLRAGDLTRNGAVYYNIRVKRGLERAAPGAAAPAFRAILEAQGRPLAAMGPQERIFGISYQTYYANLQRCARKVGLDGLKPHYLRHTAAKLRWGHGASIEDMSAFQGHRSVATTARYLARMEGERDDGRQGVAQALAVA